MNCNQALPATAISLQRASAVGLANNVPEPASLALFAIGALGLAGMTRRRKAAP
ncbi:PEP-CTERM sorting domain-containing protein [Massilia rubra]|uniref:PEP-CTERM sorting domain-containing protein n=1 Tax=Massilia rubra TaxID=2607910 RepID=A0ABX0LJL4_9BURK|nr:PEP-CTERM sorting domain-containing protein [Massilia rubra]